MKARAASSDSIYGTLTNIGNPGPVFERNALDQQYTEMDQFQHDIPVYTLADLASAAAAIGSSCTFLSIA
ncbi:mitochondrial dynamin GTPase Msp1 [Mucor velutinosus]|uniref:Mitochondrial dynamin GTPase Msp1 n=1 Tax=Mucor velutinosus TaxID=708070 RepID=A0AAN7DP00_9FUNG|nr:mitochondrial dynamin GTPase Msp1 [Mucor velutinosus]